MVGSVDTCVPQLSYCARCRNCVVGHGSRKLSDLDSGVVFTELSLYP